jgi:hypothetical protein
MLRLPALKVFQSWRLENSVQPDLSVSWAFGAAVLNFLDFISLATPIISQEVGLSKAFPLCAKFWLRGVTSDKDRKLLEEVRKQVTDCYPFKTPPVCPHCLVNVVTEDQRKLLLKKPQSIVLAIVCLCVTLTTALQGCAFPTGGYSYMGDSFQDRRNPFEDEPPAELRNQPVFCEACSMWLNGLAQFQDHIRGKKHCRATRRVWHAQRRTAPEAANILWQLPEAHDEHCDYVSGRHCDASDGRGDSSSAARGSDAWAGPQPSAQAASSSNSPPRAANATDSSTATRGRRTLSSGFLMQLNNLFHEARSPDHHYHFMVNPGQGALTVSFVIKAVLSLPETYRVSQLQNILSVAMEMPVTKLQVNCLHELMCELLPPPFLTRVTHELDPVFRLAGVTSDQPGFIIVGVPDHLIAGASQEHQQADTGDLEPDELADSETSSATRRGGLFFCGLIASLRQAFTRCGSLINVSSLDDERRRATVRRVCNICSLLDGP